MKSMQTQFHAANSDLLKFILEMISKKYYVCGIRLFDFEIVNISDDLNEKAVNEFDMVFVSKNAFTKADTYEDFVKAQDNNLQLSIGKEKDGKLFESSLSVTAVDEIDPDWKKIINKLKRSMNRGAWVKNPKTGAREYYKKHMYTDNAKKLYENGIAICPVAGWNEYELTQASEEQLN